MRDWREEASMLAVLSWHLSQHTRSLLNSIPMPGQIFSGGFSTGCMVTVTYTVRQYLRFYFHFKCVKCRAEHVALLNWAIALSDQRRLAYESLLVAHRSFLSIRKSRIADRSWAIDQISKAVRPALVNWNIGTVFPFKSLTYKSLENCTVPGLN